MIDPSDAPTQRSRARVGLVLRDKWQIDRLIGVGGMAAVYAATHTKNGRKVAIKVLHPEASMSPDVRARFLREGYAANKLEHPGTVAVLDDDVAEDGSVFLVMELLEGEALEDRRERVGGRLSFDEALRVAERVLDVLAVAHDKGVVHRDLKPDNIFVCTDGTIKLLDFGIARVRDATQARQTLTSVGAMGTPGYMPPEQARGRWDDVGPRSDLWAVGATIFTLLTGRLVHEAETANELLLAAMTRQAPPLASVVPGVPPEVAALVDRALQKEPSARWPDARAMLAAVRDARSRLTAPAPAPVPPKPAMVTAPPVPVAAAMSPAAPAYPAVAQPVPPAPFVQQAYPSAAAYGSRPSFTPAPPQAPAFAPQPGPSPAVLGPSSPGLLTGHPVTMSPALAPAVPSSGAPRGPRLGLLFSGVLAGALAMGGVLWLLLRGAPPADPRPATTSEPASAVPAVTAPPVESAAPAVESAAPPPSAAPAATEAPSATPAVAPTTSARAAPPEAPRKPGAKPPSVQDLLNRRR